MSAVTKEFEELKDRMRSENTKLSESVKSVAHKIASKSEVTNKNLSDSLTKQLREESESPKREVSNQLKPEVMNLTEAMNRLRKGTDLEITSLRDSVSTVCEKLDNKMNENMSVVQRQIEKVLQKVNQETEVLKARLAAKQASEELSAAGSSKQSVVIDINSTGQTVTTPSKSVSETNSSQSESTCSDVANVEISHVNTTTVVNATCETPANRDSLDELSLPSFVDCNKQSVVTFVRDLDMYIELKRKSLRI
jgi:hypothetical protein